MRAIPCIARRVLGGLAAVGTTVALLATTAAPAHAALPEGGLSDAVYAYLYSPNSVPGAND